MVKEFQQLIGRLVIVSRFLSWAWDKAFHLLATFKKNEKFEWMGKCEEEFMRLKSFFGNLARINAPRRMCTIIPLFFGY